jgi:hypothetical protein
MPKASPTKYSQQATKDAAVPEEPPESVLALER